MVYHHPLTMELPCTVVTVVGEIHFNTYYWYTDPFLTWCFKQFASEPMIGSNQCLHITKGIAFK